MKADKLRELNPEELQLKEKELRESIFKLRFQMAIGQREDPGKIRHLKKDLARVLTLRREEELNERKGSVGSGSSAR